MNSNREDTMVAVNVRVPRELWKRIQWLADERSMSRPELVRAVLGEAAKHAKPPEKVDAHEVNVGKREWQSWRDCAEQLNIPLDDLIKRTMGSVVRKVFNPDA